jgi:dihydrofolate reductase
MSKLIYSMNPSVDGYIAGPDGNFDWGVPSEELHRFYNEMVGELGAHLLGRKLYETMVYWETADQDSSAGEIELEFARAWQRLPKVVFSRTLDRVEGNTRLAEGGVAEEVAQLKSEVDGDIAVGGASLAAACIELGLVEEYRLFLNPVLVGGGIPYFPAGIDQTNLRLLGTRTFTDRVVYLRYATSESI